MIQVYRGLAGFLELEADWRALTSHDNRYWIQFPFYRELVKHSRYDLNTISFIAVRNNERESVAIIPVREVTLTIRRVAFCGLELLWSQHKDIDIFASSTDFPLAAGYSPEEAVARLLSTLPSLFPRVSLLHFGRLCIQSNTFASLTSLGKAIRYSINTASHEADNGFKTLDVNRDFSLIQASLDHRFQKSLRSARKRLAEYGPVSCEFVTASEPHFNNAFHNFLAVESSGWKGQSGSSTSLLANQTQSQRQLIESLNTSRSNDCAEIVSLKVGDEVIASNYCWRSGKTRATMRIGYLEKYSHYQPGHLLTKEIVKSSCSDPSIDTIDFVSNAHWLHKWPTVGNPHYQFYLPVKTVQGYFAKALLGLPSKSELRERNRVHSEIQQNTAA